MTYINTDCSAGYTSLQAAQTVADVDKKKKELKALLIELILANMRGDATGVANIQGQISEIMKAH